jgi:hypothetical protein
MITVTMTKPAPPVFVINRNDVTNRTSGKKFLI